MNKIVTVIAVPVFVIALLGTGYWGYQENQEKNSILIKAENQYQRAFHDLNFHIDKLHEELGKTLAVNSRKQLTPCLANVWRLSSLAQNEVGQLPLTLIPFNKTEEFLSNIADFTYRVSIRDLNKEPLTDNEYQTLKTLYEDSKEIQKELTNVQSKVIKNQLRWMDVEIALAQEDKKMDNTIIDGFKTIDKRVEEFPEVDWGPGISSMETKKESAWKKLKGKSISPEEAKNAAAKFLGIENDEQIKVANTVKNSDYKAYSVTINDENKVYLDITKVGGHVIWLMKNRDINEKKLNFDQALAKVKEFLETHGYKSMTATNVDNLGDTMIFNLSREENDVIIYPDSVSVKVALDNGEIVGFQSTDYIFNHKERAIGKPKLTKEQIKKYVNPNLKIESINLAIVENLNGEETLTYEVTGQLNKEYYKIYLNADNADEEDIKKVNQNDVNVEE